MTPAPLSPEEQLRRIATGMEEVIPEAELLEKLKRSVATGEPLRVKMGFDPSAPDIHLGHTVGLRKLRQFQELGHLVVLIVGDYTGMIGDPSGRSATRPQLTLDAVRANAQTYLDQFFKVVDRDRSEVHSNGEWFAKMPFMETMELASRFTVARMLERDDFEKRYKGGQPISVHEFFYPIMQGYDSVAIRADVELGGTDQKFNLLCGRALQEAHGQAPQAIVTTPILEGIDGVKRMSKSTGNYIGIDEPPREMFGKTMRIPDTLILRYFQLVTDAEPAEVEVVRARLANENPRNLKVELAQRLIRMYHGDGEAQEAAEEFDRMFRDKGTPDEMPEFSLTAGPEGFQVLQLLSDTQLIASNGEGRRLIRQGAVRIDGERIPDETIHIGARPEAYEIKVGKRKWARVTIQGA